MEAEGLVHLNGGGEDVRDERRSDAPPGEGPVHRETPDQQSRSRIRRMLRDDGAALRSMLVIGTLT